MTCLRALEFRKMHTHMHVCTVKNLMNPKNLFILKSLRCALGCLEIVVDFVVVVFFEFLCLFFSVRWLFLLKYSVLSWLLSSS